MRKATKGTEEEEVKPWKKTVNVKMGKDDIMKKDFFKANLEMGSGALFMRTLR